MARRELVCIDSSSSGGVSLRAAVGSFLGYCTSKNLSPNTIVYYRCRLEAFCRYLDDAAPGVTIDEIDAPAVRGFIAGETVSNSASTANHSVTALRSFFNYLVSDGFLDSSPMSGVQRVRQRRSIVQTFTTEQVEAILGSCGRDFTGVRDRAIILVLIDCGLRASELCGLLLDDISWTEQTMLIRGKGDRERMVPFGQTARAAISHYLARRGNLETDAVFVSCYGEPMNRHCLADLVSKRCERAGVSGVRCSPHTLRHTFAVHYLRAGGDVFSLQKILGHTLRHTFAVAYLRSGGDVFSLQKILGHSDLAMTRRYCELSQTDALERHKLHSPGDALARVKNTARRTRIAQHPYVMHGVAEGSEHRARSVLAWVAQSWELRIMMAIVPVVRGRRGIHIIAWIHDGCVLHLQGHPQAVETCRQELVRAVDDVLREIELKAGLSIGTRLTVEQLPPAVEQLAPWEDQMHSRTAAKHRSCIPVVATTTRSLTGRPIAAFSDRVRRAA